MAIVPIASPDDERLAIFRNLADAELRARRDAFVAEGRLVVRRLLADSPLDASAVMVTEVALAALEDLVADRADLPVLLVPQAVMNAVAGFDVHRGCLAAGRRPRATPWTDLAAAGGPLVALERVGDADNVGTVFRHTAAFGGSGVLLGPGCADPLYRKAIRTSMGASLSVRFAAAEPWPGALTRLRGDGWAVVGLTPAAGATPLRDVVDGLSGSRVVLVAGHEGDGLSAGAIGACSVRARIPIADGVDSLNVSAAVAIALYEVSR